jgi:outer membrane protein assembly factor BamB
VTRVTTICCSVLALLALARAPEPLPLVPLRPVWKLALNSHVAFPGTYDLSRGYFAIDNNRLVAYDMASGAQRWLVEAHPLLQPVAADDLVYIVDADGIVALHADSGQPAWRTTLNDPLAVRPTAGHGWLIAATKTGDLVAIRASNGEIVWQQNVGSPLHAPPTIRGDRIFAPTADSRIVARDLESGGPAWERKVAGSPNEILAVADRLYAGSTDNFLYCLMAGDGRIDWRWRTGGDISAAPVADSRAVYFVSYDNVVRALNLVSGGQYWMKPLPFRPTSGLLLSGTTVVVAGQSAAIKTFNAKDGVPAVDIAAGEEVAAPPQLLEDPKTHLPMLVIITRHIVNGDSVSLSIRSIEPAATPFGPLPNTVTPPPMQATRP